VSNGSGVAGSAGVSGRTPAVIRQDQGRLFANGRQSHEKPIVNCVKAITLLSRSRGGLRVDPRPGSHRDHVSGGPMRTHDGRRGAGQDGPGRTECYDSGNDDGSPDTHDSSMASTEVRSLLCDLIVSPGESDLCGDIAGPWLFHTHSVRYRVQFLQILNSASPFAL